MENWIKIKLGEICLPKGGVQTGPFGSQLHAEEYTNEGIPVIMPKDICKGLISVETIARIPEEIAVRLKKHRLKVGDIVFARRGDIGRCGLVTEIEQGWICGTGCLRIRLNETIKSEVLIHILRLPETTMWLVTNAVGQTMLNLNTSILADLPLEIPPLDEQEKIAEILSTWDKSIETAEKLIAAKQKLKKSLMQRLLTGSQRFPEFHGQEWEEVRLKDVFSEIRNINDGGDSHSVMTISARRGLISQQDKFNRVIAGDSLKKYTQLKRGDFAYNKGNSKTYEMGCIYQLESKESALVPFVYICFSPSEKVFSGFYKHWFLAHGLDSQLKKIITSGARGDGLLNVNSEDFFKLKIPVPPLEEQKKIAAVLNASDAEINVLQNKLHALRQQKRGLMQKLLTGKVRVKINEFETTEA